MIMTGFLVERLCIRLQERINKISFSFEIFFTHQNHLNIPCVLPNRPSLCSTLAKLLSFLTEVVDVVFDPSLSLSFTSFGGFSAFLNFWRVEPTSTFSFPLEFSNRRDFERSIGEGVQRCNKNHKKIFRPILILTHPKK